VRAPARAPGRAAVALVRRHIRAASLAVVLLAVAVVSIFPLVWMISTSLKMSGLEFTFPPELIPDPVAWSNYTQIWTMARYDLYMRNSFAVTLLATVGTMLSASLVAYGFARLRFFGRDFWFVVLLSTLMLPDIVTLIPRFILFRLLGWYDTLLPLIVPAWFGGGAFYVFLIRQYYLTLPYELEEAARVDGAGTLYIYGRIMLPLSGPVLAAVVVFSFVSNWNDFLGPLIFTQSPETRTLALGLRSFLGQYKSAWNMLMVGSVLMLVPVLALFFTAQQYFVKGVALTGLAGR